MSLLTPSPEAYDHIRRLRVVRAYAATPISPDAMQRILHAARWTGSSKNTQGWEFIVVTGERLQVLATAGNFTDPVRNSAATIALVQTPVGNPFDIGRAAQNIMLAAAAEGIGSCAITFHNTAVAVEVMRLPEGHECRWGVSLGYPLDDAEIRARAARRASGMGGRKALDDLVHHQFYGG